jgi:hypothetical protein
MLRGICGQSVNNFSGQPVGPILKVQSAFFDCFVPVAATEDLSRTVGNYSGKSTNQMQQFLKFIT